MIRSHDTQNPTPPGGGDRFSDPVLPSAKSQPIPPAIYEPTARLVYSDLGLPELFARTATTNGMAAELLHPEDIAGTIAEHLRSLGQTSVAVADSKMLKQLQLDTQLSSDGFSVTTIPTRDAPVGVTDCFAAVAETGSIVFRRSVDFFLPPQSIVILEPKNFVADLIDLLAGAPGQVQDMLILSGPNRVRVLILH